MANLTRTTRDHDEIRRWAEERGGKPAHVKSTGSSDDPGILRIDFPGYSGEGSLEPITWEQWFDKFDERGLSLIYEEETAGGAKSNFNKIVSAETAQQAEQKSRERARGAAARSGSSTKKASSKKASVTKKAAASKKKSAGGAARRSVGSARKGAAGKAASKGAKKTAAKSAKKASGKKAASKKRR